MLGLAKSGRVSAIGCTELIGHSQANQWYTSGFEDIVNDDEYQIVWANGGSIDYWGSPFYWGWDLEPESPCIVDSTTPQRIILNVAGSERPISEWVNDIEDAVETTWEKRPTANEIVLMAIVGGPDHAVCMFGSGFWSQPVQASVNHPDIDAAIEQVAVNNADVTVGFSPEVASCNQYADSLGHLTPAGSSYVAQTAGEYYSD